jgi:TetR/AcrR family transcriptional repressor of nem operon
MPIQKVNRDEIIKASLRVFRQRGYYRTSMKDLANELGLTKGVFYHHFPDKEALMREALQAFTVWFDRKVFALAKDQNKSVQQRLDEMAKVTFEAFTADLGGCFFANTVLETAHVEDTFMDDLKDFFTRWQNALAELLSENYSEKRSLELADQIIADVEGSIILMQLHKNPVYLKKSLKRTRKLLEA